MYSYLVLGSDQLLLGVTGQRYLLIWMSHTMHVKLIKGVLISQHSPSSSPPVLRPPGTRGAGGQGWHGHVRGWTEAVRCHPDHTCVQHDANSWVHIHTLGTNDAVQARHKTA
jgi:hypothetical protein